MRDFNKDIVNEFRANNGKVGAAHGSGVSTPANSLPHLSTPHCDHAYPRGGVTK